MNYLIGQQIENYQVEALLGDGGMGSVYRALDLQHDRLVALKVMHGRLSRQPQFRQRFTQEAQSVFNFNNPAIIKIHQQGTYQDLPYIAMDYVAGGSLTDYLKQLRWAGKKLSLSEIITIGAQVAEGLGYAHQRGVVHRDIKPDNILLRLHGRAPGTNGGSGPSQAVITDFGLAIQLTEGQELATNPFMGSLPYMSPEQCTNASLDGRSDIYSLGIMLYQLTTGQLPFKIDAPADIVKHLEEQPLPPRLVNPHIPESVETIILKAIAKRPSDRYQTGAELAHTLRQAALATDPSVTIPRSAADARVTQWVERRWVAGVEVASRIDVNQTWISEGNFRLFVAHQWEESRVQGMALKAFTIGRDPQNHIVLPENSVSGQHVKVEQTNIGWQVRDLGSTNGTYLDNTHLEFDKPLAWNSDQTLRVGPYALKWQAFQEGQHRPVVGTVTRVPDSAAQVPQPAPMATAGPPLPVPAVVPAPEVPDFPTVLSSGSDVLHVTIAPAEMELDPGAETYAQITIHNLGLTVEDISLRAQVDGLPTTWITLDESVLKLMPDEMGTVTAILTPPHDSSLSAGEHAFELIAANARGESAIAVARIHLTRWEDFSLDMHPTNLQEKVTCRLTIDDRSNFTNTYNVVGLDESDALLFDFDDTPEILRADVETQQQWLKLPAGGDGNVSFTIKPRKRPWFARNLIFPYEVRVRTETADWQTLYGQLEARPRITTRVLLLFLLLLLIFGASGFYGYRALEQRRIEALAEQKRESDAILAAAQAAREEAESRAQQARDEEAAAQAALEEAIAEGRSEEEIAALQAQAEAAQAEAAQAEAEAAAAAAEASAAEDAAAQAAAQAAAVNNPPTDLQLDVTDIPENAPVGTVVGRFTAVDPDTAALRTREGVVVLPIKTPIRAKNRLQTAGFTYSLVSGSGDSGNRAFEIDDDALKTAIVFDYETQSSYNIRVEVDDGNGGTFQKEFTIFVTDLDDTPAVALADVTVAEDTGKATITVSLTGENNDTVTVDYSLSDVTALSGKDYTNTSGTLSWVAGETDPITFDISIIEDNLDEDDETFTVTLSNVTNATIDTGKATVTITDDDDLPELSVSDLTVTKSVAGGQATITVMMTGGSSSSVSVNYATADGTAEAGDDYVSTSGTLTWSSGQIGANLIHIPLIDDLVNEPDETFTITLSRPQNATIDQGTATVTITDDDTIPQLTIADANVAEEDGSVTITVSMTGESSLDVSVDYATSDGTGSNGAKAGVSEDYLADSGTVTWLAGTTGSKTFDITINDDSTYEPGGESFNITLSNPENGAIADALGVVNIADIDPQPTVEMEKASDTVDERSGNNPNTIIVNVILNGASNQQVSVNFTTVDGTPPATEIDDYRSITSSPVTWNPGQTGAKPIEIRIVGDDLYEDPDEVFEVRISSPVNATIVSGLDTSTITIIDDDGPPQLSVADFSIAEDGGTARVPVTMSGASSQQIRVTCDTVSTGSASAGTDYTATPVVGTLTWNPGETGTKNCEVNITDDQIYEGNETFEVQISLNPPPTGAQITDDTGVVTITEDDPMPELSITSITPNPISESAGSLRVTLNVVNDRQSSLGMSVDFDTADGSATASTGDYTPVSGGTLTWNPGDSANTIKPIQITILNDDIDELASEDFEVILSGASGATIDPASTSSTITIQDDDAPPVLAIGAFSVSENVSGLTARVPVTMTRGSYRSIQIDYDFTDITATGGTSAPADYNNTSGSISWPANVTGTQRVQTINVPLFDDNLYEGPSETLNITIDNITPAGAATFLGGGSSLTAQLTIVENETPPTLAIQDATVVEGDPGATVTGVVTITLSAASGTTISVNYSTTTGGTASSTDYTSVSGTRTWLPGDSTPKTFNVPIIEDELDETSETVAVVISNAVPATIGFSRNNGILTIADDDSSPVVTAGQTRAIAENATGTIGAALSATDADTPSASLSGWAITPATPPFTINATTGQLSTSSPLDAETQGPFTVNVTVSDGVNTSAAQSVTINVTDVNDVAPVVTPGQTRTVVENVTGSFGAPLAFTDGDVTPTASPSWTLVGVSPTAPFAITAGTGQLRTTSPLDFEVDPTNYTITVTVSDGTNLSAQETVAITLADANDIAPVVTAGQSRAVNENFTGTIPGGALQATDADTVGTIQSWGIVSVSPSGPFAINNSGVLRTTADLNYESSPITYTLSVTASDGINTSTPVGVIVTVNDVNDAPALNNINGTSVLFTTQGPFVAIAPGGTVIDEDAPVSFNTGTLRARITSNVDRQDQILIRQTSTITNSGTTVNYQGTAIGTCDRANCVATQNPPILIITLNNNTNIARTQALVRHIAFNNTDGTGSQNPNPRTAEFRLTDGVGGTSNLPTVTVNVQ